MSYQYFIFNKTECIYGINLLLYNLVYDIYEIQ